VFAYYLFRPLTKSDKDCKPFDMKKRTSAQEEKLKVSADGKINGLRPAKVG
jgi:hypothetical protein